MKVFTVLAALALIACVRGQPGAISLTASNRINYLYVDNEQFLPLNNAGNWQEPDHLVIENYTRLVAIRANNVEGGCSGLLVAIQNHPFGYNFVSDMNWRCSGSPNGNWQFLGYDDSSWTPAHEVGPNEGVIVGCSWIHVSGIPTNANWIWTPAFNNGDEIVSCRGYTPICEYAPCQNGGTCNRNAANLCSCPVRWGGRFCELEIDECDSNPCLNGGLCSLTDEGYACQCQIGSTGVRCETDTTDCANNPCENGGTCNFELPSGYTCSCAPGFNGTDCENNIDECEITPCLNGATCTDAVDGVQCSCVPGYTGYLCQNDIFECASNPCQNAGDCYDLVNGYDCDCRLGYEGDRCETPTGACIDSPCMNGGTCTLEGPGGDVQCLCTAGWYGPLCDSNENECISEPCQNGGTCIDGEQSFQCRCTDEFDGPLCQDVAPHCGSYMMTSTYAPARNFWTLCEINIIDHPELTDITCTDLIDGIPYYNNSDTIKELGGTYGCYPTKYPDEMPNGACIPDYNQNAKLGTCLSCTHMGVCIDVPPPK